MGNGLLKLLRDWPAALLVAVTMVLGSASGAAAADRTHAAVTHKAVIKAPMTLDCVNMSADAHEYAVTHNLCPASGAGTDGVVYGDCGDSFVFVDPAGNGDASFTWGFDSSEGSVIDHELVVDAWGASGPDSIPDAQLGPGTPDYANGVTRYEGIGPIHAVLSGEITLWFGGTCTIGNPTADTNIN